MIFPGKCSIGLPPAKSVALWVACSFNVTRLRSFFSSVYSLSLNPSLVCLVSPLSPERVSNGLCNLFYCDI